MSYKDLGSKNIPPRVETPEDAELKARALARHKAKEAKASKSEEHREVEAKKDSHPPGSGRGEPPA